MTAVFQIWAESEANAMWKLVLTIFFRIEDVLPPMTTCLKSAQSQRLNSTYFVLSKPNASSVLNPLLF